MRCKRLTCIGEHFTPNAAKCAAYARQLFTTGAAKREVPRPKALIDLGKLRKVIWLRFRLRLAGIRQYGFRCGSIGRLEGLD